MGIEIRLYRPVTAERAQFESAGLALDAASITTTDALSTPGDFAFTLPLGGRCADRVEKGLLVRIDKLFWGIIDGLSFGWDRGGPMVEVSGRQLKGLTADRITVPPLATEIAGAQGYDAYSGSTEAVIKHYVDANMVRALQAKRNYPGLLIALDRGRGRADDRYITRHDKLDEVLKSLCEAAGLGYDIAPDLDNGAYVFDVIQGADRSGVQGERPRVVFDIARRTAESQTYTTSQRDECNIFYATRSGAEFEDEALTMMYVRDGEEERGGIYRREQHLSVSADTPTAGQEYDELRRVALIEAENYKAADSFACKVMDSGLSFGRDYFVGDTVTVQNREWGILMHPMLTAMTTDYSAGGITRTATFGKAPLGVFGRLRRQIKGG